MTATMLPSWITAVADTPGSSQPARAGTTFRWAVLLMGKNSVSPCTTPNTTFRQMASKSPGSDTSDFLNEGSRTLSLDPTSNDISDLTKALNQAQIF